MHLSSVKIAGFKSFHQPTSLVFPSNRVVMVGPNGCGKSNIIDAIRWVLGESTSSGLRSHSLDDIIFSGTEDYPALGRTSIELTFDNRNQPIGGKFSNQDYIKVRRTLERDSSSRYYINGQTCRRKDIEELFAGMGLTGKANYAIITQGTIHSLVESKPEHIYLLIEEAANITDYRHKRKATLTHIKNTRVNLKQVSIGLHDSRTRMNTLKKQAQDAEAFHNHQQQLRKLKQDLIIASYQDTKRQQQQGQQKMTATVETLENHKNTIAKLMIEKQQMDLAKQDSTSQLENLIAKQTQLNHDIVSLEASQKYNQQRSEEIAQRLHSIDKDLQHNQATIESETQQLALINNQLRQQTQSQQNNKSQDKLIQLTNQLGHLDQQWQDLLLQLSETKAMKQRLQAQLDDGQQEINQLEAASLDIPTQQKTPDLEQPIISIEKNIRLLESDIKKIQQAKDTIAAKIGHTEQDKYQIEQEMTRINTLVGELESLATHGSNKPQSSQADTLWYQKVTPPTKWEKALDMVAQQLGDAKITLNLEDSLKVDINKQEMGLAFVTKINNQPDEIAGMLSLGSMMKGEYIPAFLYHIYACDNIKQAVKLTKQLKSYQSLITPAGEWLGSNWMILKQDNHKKAGVFAQQTRLKNLLAEKTQIENKHQAYVKQINTAHRQIQTYDEQVQHKKSLLAEQQTELARLHKQLDEAKEDETRHRETLIKINYDKQRKTELVNKVSQIKHQLSQSSGEEQRQQQQKSDLEKKRTGLTNQIHSLEKDTAQQQLSQRESLVSQKATLEKSLSDRQHNHQRFIEQKKQLNQQHSQNSRIYKKEQQKLAKLTDDTAGLKPKISSYHQKIKQLDQQQERLTTQLAKSEKSIALLERDLQQLQATNEQLSLDLTGMLNHNDPKLLSQQEPLPDIDDLKERIRQLERFIDRSGDINQLALRDYKVCKAEYEEKEEQRSEILNALRILEKSVRKIDRNSKKKFTTTFNNLNKKFQQFFSQLSGGGTAYLEEYQRDGDETQGIKIMVSPYGRRKTNIASLSGGEKTVVAIALIMAIFHLNPSPFCLMDEADAMLDDENVMRFNNMVASMSANTQFVLVSHNKLTISNAQHLIGITMAEPGISQIVSVDMDKALELSRQAEG